MSKSSKYGKPLKVTVLPRRGRNVFSKSDGTKTMKFEVDELVEHTMTELIKAGASAKGAEMVFATALDDERKFPSKNNEDFSYMMGAKLRGEDLGLVIRLKNAWVEHGGLRLDNWGNKSVELGITNATMLQIEDFFNTLFLDKLREMVGNEDALIQVPGYKAAIDLSAGGQNTNKSTIAWNVKFANTGRWFGKVVPLPPKRVKGPDGKYRAPTTKPYIPPTSKGGSTTISLEDFYNTVNAQAGDEKNTMYVDLHVTGFRYIGREGVFEPRVNVVEVQNPADIVSRKTLQQKAKRAAAGIKRPVGSKASRMAAAKRAKTSSSKSKKKRNIIPTKEEFTNGEGSSGLPELPSLSAGEENGIGEGLDLFGEA